MREIAIIQDIIQKKLNLIAPVTDAVITNDELTWTRSYDGTSFPLTLIEDNTYPSALVKAYAYNTSVYVVYVGLSDTEYEYETGYTVSKGEIAITSASYDINIKTDFDINDMEESIDFVSDVEEYADYSSFPAIGADNTVYKALDTELLYRWDDSDEEYDEVDSDTETVTGFTYTENTGDYTVVLGKIFLTSGVVITTNKDANALQSIVDEENAKNQKVLFNISASSYGKGHSFSCNWELNFDVPESKVDDVIDDCEELREYLHDTENGSIESNDYRATFKTNAIPLLPSDISESLGKRLLKIYMSGACTISDDAVFGQDVITYIKIDSGEYQEVVNVISKGNEVKTATPDLPLNGEQTRDNTPLSAGASTTLILQYKYGNTLHDTLFGYCSDNESMFDSSDKPIKISYKQTLYGTTLIEWETAYIISPTVTMVSGDYVQLTIPIERSA